MRNIILLLQGRPLHPDCARKFTLLLQQGDGKAAKIGLGIEYSKINIRMPLPIGYKGSSSIQGLHWPESWTHSMDFAGA